VVNSLGEAVKRAGIVGEINVTLPVSLQGTVTLSGQGTLSDSFDIKWIDGATEPDAPDGYARLPALDLEIPIKVLDTTLTAKLWAFKKT
jgi:hypothetical protein